MWPSRWCRSGRTRVGAIGYWMEKMNQDQWFRGISNHHHVLWLNWGSCVVLDQKVGTHRDQQPIFILACELVRDIKIPY